MAVPLQTTSQFKHIFRPTKCLELKFTSIVSKGPICKASASDNGLAPNRRQAVARSPIKTEFMDAYICAPDLNMLIIWSSGKWWIYLYSTYTYRYQADPGNHITWPRPTLDQYGSDLADENFIKK